MAGSVERGRARRAREPRVLSEDTPGPVGSDGGLSIVARVVEIVAQTCALSPAEVLAAASSAIDWPLDSLSSVAIVARLESAFGIELGEGALALLAARDVTGLGRSIVEKLAELGGKLDEATRNGSC